MNRTTPLPSSLRRPNAGGTRPDGRRGETSPSPLTPDEHDLIKDVCRTLDRRERRRFVRPIPPELLARVMREDAEFNAGDKLERDVCWICGLTGGLLLLVGCAAMLS